MMSLPILFLFFIVFLSFFGSPLLMKDAKGCGISSSAIIAGVILFVLFVALIAFFDEGRHVAKVPKTIHKAIDGVEHLADNLSDTLGDLEKELDEFTKPQIDLGEESETPATKEERSEESATELESEPKLGEPLPAWVTDPPESEEGVWQRVVSTEPCFTMESLKHERASLIVKTLSDYLDEQLDSEIPQDVLHQEERRHEFFVGTQKRGIYTRHTETRETSVGDASIFHLMINIDSSDKKWFEEQLEISRTEKNRANRGLRATGVGWLSVVVLCGLAVLYELLRVSEK